MFRLTLALLFLLPGLALGQTVKLPPEIIVTQDATLVQPEFSDITKLQDVKWAVLGLKVAPSFSYLEPPFVGKSHAGIMLRSPAVGDEITIVVVALFSNGKLSDPAITTLKRGSGGTTPTQPPTTNPPVTPVQPPVQPVDPGVDRDIPAGVTNISAILVVDPNNVSADISALATGVNAITKALGRGQGAWYVRMNTDSLVSSLQPSIAGRTLPVLLVIDGRQNPKKVIGAVSITPTGSADLTARKIITQIANALGP